jgi:RNA polymerase sigma-70 factor, ECF subfamily
VPTEIERLYREHRAGLVRLVERELHDQDEAEDVVQTAFLAAQRALERGTIPRNPRAWLAAIALNAGRRLRRRRLNAEPLEDYAVQEASRMSEIRAALTGLPSEQRAAVLYRDLLGLSYGETADQMGTSVNAVTMLLYRGRQRLRETLGVTSGGVGWWRWLKQPGTPQVAVVKGAAAVVAAAGLAAGGVVVAGHAARVVAPVRADTVFTLAATSGKPAAALKRTPGALMPGSTRRHFKATDRARSDAGAASTQGVARAATQASVPSPTAAPSSSTLRVPAVPLSALPTPTLPATVTVVTPITVATVTVPTGTTATIATPVTTATLPIP